MSIVHIIKDTRDPLWTTWEAFAASGRMIGSQDRLGQFRVIWGVPVHRGIHAQGLPAEIAALAGIPGVHIYWADLERKAPQ